MKKERSKSIVILLTFVLLSALGAYCVLCGLGKSNAGNMRNIKLGLDLAGGVSITYEIADENPTQTDIDDTIYKLQRRVDTYSTEGVVYQEGSNRISIEIPGVSDANAILEDLGKPGSLEFIDEENMEKKMSGEEYTPALTGSDVKNAQAGIDNSKATKDYLVSLAFTDEGVKKFADVTSANVGKVIYIVYDNEIVSYPQVQEAITGGNAVVNKIDTYEEAESLATTIRIGALPLELRELRSNVVGAKLGEEAISTSLKAGCIGVALVCVLLIIIYLVPGAVASLALLAYVILTLLCLNAFNVTLTLPGLAGIILSIGMAVDANVIIFTRIKEEIATGKSAKAAIDAGFHKALSAILDGNITTLIAAGVLWWRGTGAVKGFAQTLAIGILLSMFTALIVTKYLLKSLQVLGVNNVKCYGNAKKLKVTNYVKASKICGIISILAIAAGLIFLPINKQRTGQALNFSLEFVGGTSISASFEEDYTLSDAEQKIRPVVAEAAGIAESTIQLQNVAGVKQIIIKTPELTVTQREAVENALNESFNVTEYATENISSTISNEMQRDAILAVAFAAILMLVYIAFRFKDVKFGVSSVMALIHDVLVVFALYSIARLSVGDTFIACMLTIVGYSINATIIIFDRVRENLNTMSVKKDGLAAIVNTSVSQTFTRTIYTSLTTLVMVLVLYILGVPSIKEFALTLMAGIVVGGYSSVCISGPLWYGLKKVFEKKEAK